MLNLKTELAGAMAALAITGRMDSGSDIMYIAAQRYNKIIYVTISKPYHTFSEFFKVNKINPDKFFFVDCITKTVLKKPKGNGRVAYVSSPTNFEWIEKAIKKALQQQQPDLLIFDSLSSLLVYKKEIFVTRFMHHLAAMIKGFHNKSVFIVLEKDAGLDLAKNMGMVMDKTIYVL